MQTNEKYRYYADGITALHFFWTFVIFAGAVLMFFWRTYAMVEIVVVSFTLLISLPFGAVCPLTLLEERLRRKLDSAYRNHGSYLAVYINKFFHTHFKVRSINISVGIIYFLIYAFAFTIYYSSISFLR